MTIYEQPALPAVAYRDETGEPIPYGQRWNGGSPPEDAYSRTSNLDRFAPLHTIAEALIEWLVAAFDVTLTRDAAVVSDLLLAPDNVVGAVRVTPRDPHAAPLTIVLTSFPGVYVHAGALHDLHFPVCGCDACDDDIAALADEFEWTVRTIVTGGYSERIDSRSGRLVGYRLQDDTGTRSSLGRVQDFPADRMEAARRVLPSSGRWSAWPART